MKVAKMTTHSKPLYIVGIVLTGLGSFLPWENAGDAIPYWTPGIRIYFNSVAPWLRGVHTFPVEDTGGLLILIVSAVIVVLVFRTPDFVKRPQVWVLVSSISLVALAAYHVTSLFLRSFGYHGIIGAPSIQIGLIMMSLGSLVVLYTAISDYRKHRAQLMLSGDE